MRLQKLFDDATFTQVDAFAKSEGGYAEAVAGYGYINGTGVYAIAQNSDLSGGAMSQAQAAKIKKVYDLAKKQVYLLLQFMIQLVEDLPKVHSF